MIVNRLHQFVFVHIPKTGGTSVQAALRTVPGSVRPPVKGTHRTLTEIAALPEAGGSELLGFRVFCFVRNPWDRMLSLHRYLRREDRRHKHPAPAAFSDFVDLLKAPPQWLSNLQSIRPQTDFVTVDAFVGRFETLERDFKVICERLGISAVLPRLNATSAARIDYRPYYTAEAASVVADRFADEIIRFGYSFDSVGSVER